MKPLRVLLVDDHALVRAGLRELLQKLPDVEVVAEAGDGREALGLVKSALPNLVLLDITMKGLTGLEAAERIVKDFPGVKVVMLSMHANEEYVLRALRAGVSGYIIKDAAIVELELAIKAVVAEETYLSPSISRSVIENYLNRTGDKSSPLEQLTPRQREILQLIAEGQSTKEIAFTLKLSVKTVETHRAQLMDRLEIYDVAGLVRYAMRVGLITPE
ncbi:MAG TPA: response regulator transcription factor [Verrucomicrobiae bacterium]|nr:response regulator transcription factor [Verrucomicrobiae bacterium]